MPLHIKHTPNPGLPELPDAPVIPNMTARVWIEQADILDGANKHLQGVQTSIEELKKQAFKEGHAEGYDTGKLDGLDFIRQAAITYEGTRNKLWHEVIDLVEQCVHKIVGEMDTKTRISRMVEQALDAKKDTDATVLKVSADLAGALGETLHYKHASREHVLYVQVDPNLEGERCIVVCPRHIVECNIEAQISNLKNTLLAHPPEFESETYTKNTESEKQTVFDDDDTIGMTE